MLYVTLSTSPLLGSALAWFILFLIALAIVLWLLSWLLFPEAEPASVGATLEGLTGMNQDIAGKLAPFGIRTDRDLMRLTPRGQQELESQLGLHNGEYDRWRREVLAKWRNQYLPAAFREIQDITPDPELGGVYARRPKETDDLTKLHDVDKTTASRLNNAGIYTFEQLRLLTPEQRACIKQKFHLSSFDFDRVPDYGVTAQWLAFLAENPEGAKQSRSRPEASAQGTRGNVADTSTVATVDASGADADKIVASSFASSQALKSASDSLDSLDLQKDSDSSVDTTRQTETLPDVAPTTNASETIPRSRMDADLGHVYTSPPPHRDDLTSLTGITASTEAKLNAAGIFTADQIRSLSPSQRDKFRLRFDLPAFDFSQWSGGSSGHVPKPHFELPGKEHDAQLDTHAAPNNAASNNTAPTQSHYASSTAASKTIVGFAVGHTDAPESTEPNVPSYASGSQADDTPATHESKRMSPSASAYGHAYSEKPDDADSLERLPSIDRATAAALNEAGIYKYEQLASLDLAQQTQLRQEFGLEDANFAEWQRLIFAWSRGLNTSIEVGPVSQRTGWLHTVRLPVVASGVFDGQQLVAYPEQVVFRGTAPEYWGQSIKEARDGVARSSALADIRTDVNYVRIRRMDTRESVVTKIAKSGLFEPGPDDSSGWNGLCEIYLGARHLGVFASQVPTEAETKFGLGGWGFGHSSGRPEQAYSWAGRLIPPTAFEISVGRIGPAAGTVVFRSSDPTIWNQRIQGEASQWAIPIEDVAHPISFVRIMRTDTGQGVVVRTNQASVSSRSANPRLGWNGLNEHFYGGHHLGVYLQTAPQQVEIAYGEGGWGFGHPYGDDDRQAYGWAGQAIRKTVFEISVFEFLPEYLRHELLEN